MKGLLLLLLCVFLFCGCAASNQQIDQAIQLRNNLLNGNGCAFDACVTADYGDQLFSFSVHCVFDKEGNLNFSVLEPQTVNGITGTINAQGGALTFDDKVLSFEMLADDQITPVTAPWVMIKAVRSGYIAACGKDDSGYQLRIDDSYEDNALQMDLWIDPTLCITHADFLWEGRRVLSLQVSNFSWL